MSLSPLSSETLHATCVARHGRALLILGSSGTGKSDLALRLIDRGASLVSDDYTIVRRVDGRLLAAAPQNIDGRMEVRGVGIVPLPAVRDVPVCLAIDLGRPASRMPTADEALMLAGVRVPVIGLSGLEASAPIKAEWALDRLGTPIG
jgi:serine kinase of HPr protein (carbohydrate metabolism regulator)